MFKLVLEYIVRFKGDSVNGFWNKLNENELKGKTYLIRVSTRPGKPGKIRVHLENLKISWNFENFNRNHGKMIWNLEKNWVCTKNPLLNLNRLEGRFINLEYNWNGQFFVQMKIGKFVDVNQNNLEITFKIMKKIPGNLLENLEKITWKSHGILSVRKSGNPDLILWTLCYKKLKYYLL